MKTTPLFFIATLILFAITAPVSRAKDFKASISTNPGIPTAPIKLLLDQHAVSATLGKCINPIVKVKITAHNTQKTAARFETVQLFAKDGSLIGLNKASKTDALALTPFIYSFEFPLTTADVKKGVGGVLLSFIDVGGDDVNGKVAIIGSVVSIECQTGSACVAVADAVVSASPPSPPTVASLQGKAPVSTVGGSIGGAGSAITAGPQGGGAFASGGTGTVWTSPGNATVQDAIYTTSGVIDGTPSQDLQARNFGFSIPSTATINGIEFVVRLVVQISPGVVNDNFVQFVKAGTAVGTNFSRGAGVNWPITDTNITFGGPTQLAGVAWTPTDINNTNFGINISAIAGVGEGSSLPIAIDHISAKIYYTTGSASVYDTFRGFPKQMMDKFFCALLRQKCE